MAYFPSFLRVNKSSKHQKTALGFYFFGLHIPAGPIVRGVGLVRVVVEKTSVSLKLSWDLERGLGVHDLEPSKPRGRPTPAFDVHVEGRVTVSGACARSLGDESRRRLELPGGIPVDRIEERRVSKFEDLH